MTLYNIFDRYLFLPLGDLVYGSCVVAKLKEMRHNDHLTEKEIRNIQDEKLQRLVQHCYKTVPYYTKLFDRLGIKPEQIRTREDLNVLPVLIKQIIRDNYNDLFSTSDKIFSLGGNSINQKNNIFSFKGLYDRIIMRNNKFSSADVSDECMQRHYNTLMKLKPSAIRGYGSALYILARYIEKNNLPVCPVKVVLTTGEVLVPDYRRKLQEVFKAPVYDAYGAGDGGILSHECPKHEGLHISEESCIIEITDEQGNPKPDGITGQVCTTDLDNYAFPFLRYLVGDMAYIKKEKCSCGRASRLIGEVMGRAGKLIYNKQGTPISPIMLWIMMYPQLNYHVAEHQNVYSKIDKFQIRQDKEGDILILLKIKDPNEPKEQFNYILDNYRKHFVGSTVDIQFVEEIPCLPSGKEDYCMSEYEYNV